MCSNHHTCEVSGMMNCMKDQFNNIHMTKWCEKSSLININMIRYYWIMFVCYLEVLCYSQVYVRMCRKIIIRMFGNGNSQYFINTYGENHASFKRMSEAVRRLCIFGQILYFLVRTVPYGSSLYWIRSLGGVRTFQYGTVSVN